MSKSIVVYLDKYCVYTHSVEGEIFYVGKGTGSRPFSHELRNDAWKAIASGVGKVEINIVDWYENEDAALEVEKVLIRKLRPIANLNGGGPRKPKSLINRGEGRYQPTALNVARLTRYGHIRDRDTFDFLLRDHLDIPAGGEIPKGWADAYNKYFFCVDEEYLKKKDRKVCIRTPSGRLRPMVIYGPPTGRE